MRYSLTAAGSVSLSSRGGGVNDYPHAVSAALYVSATLAIERVGGRLLNCW